MADFARAELPKGVDDNHGYAIARRILERNLRSKIASDNFRPVWGGIHGDD